MTCLFYSAKQDIAKNLTKGLFAHNLKNGSDIFMNNISNSRKLLKHLSIASYIRWHLTLML